MEVVSNQELRVIPGGIYYSIHVRLDRVGDCSEYDNGDGTFVDNGIIYSSIVGTLHKRKQDCIVATII